MSSIYRGRTGRDFYLASLLYDSIDDNNFSAVKSLLCGKGADPNLVLPKKGISPFHLAIGCDSNEFAVKVTRLILQNGGNPNVKSDDRLTPLHIAAAWGRLDILRLLLSCGGDAEARDANCMTPVHYAKKENNVDCANLLVAHLPVKNNVMKKETEDCYDLILDKVLLNNGFAIGEYQVVDEYKPDSIKAKPLDSLPQSSPKDYVLNWFDKQTENLSKSTGDLSCSDSFLSPDSSSIDESDNDNNTLSKLLNLTFRKCYTKKRKISKTVENSPGCFKEETKRSNFSLDQSELSDEKSEIQEYSRETGVVTLPCIVKQETEDTSSGYKSNGTGVKLETACSGYKSYSVSPDKTNEIPAKTELACSGYKSYSPDGYTPSKLVTKSDVDYINNRVKLADGSSSDYITCSSINQLERNVFDFSDESKKHITKSNTDLSFVSVSEVYKYEDKGEGIVLYERRLLKTSSELNGSTKTGSLSSKMSSLPEVFDYDTDTLRAELTGLGYQPGPITVSTKKVYLKKLYQLKRHPTMGSKVPARRVYSVELEKTLRDTTWCSDLTSYKSLEEILSKEFSSPDPSRKWREGVNKSSFTYLLLDPRVTNNLPCRADVMEPKDVWETFLSSIFYVGKGKRSRPYSHLYEAVACWKRGDLSIDNKKLGNILDIWKDNSGVICLHVFQNIIPVEAYTREAAMISALKLENLTNVRAGEYYGVAATWAQKPKRLLGVYLLYKAMKIFLNEGERQLYPMDID